MGMPRHVFESSCPFSSEFYNPIKSYNSAKCSTKSKCFEL